MYKLNRSFIYSCSIKDISNITCQYLKITRDMNNYIDCSQYENSRIEERGQGIVARACAEIFHAVHERRMKYDIDSEDKFAQTKTHNELNCNTLDRFI